MCFNFELYYKYQDQNISYISIFPSFNKLADIETFFFNPGVLANSIRNIKFY